MNAKIRFYALLAALLFAGGCGLLSDSDGEDFLSVRPRLGEPFRLQVEGTAHVQADSVRLYFSDAFDSRCPKGAECIIAGLVRTRLLLLRSDQAPVEINLRGLPPEEGYDEVPGRAGGLMQDTLGYRVSLLRLDPYPGTEGDSDTPAVATLRVDASGE